MKRLWIRFVDGPNVGDRACSPLSYARRLELQAGAGDRDVEVDLKSVQSDVVERTGAGAIVIGGGGLLMQSMMDFLYAILCVRREIPVVVWAVGSNFPLDIDPDQEYPKWLDNAQAVGIRDVGARFPWLPCVSCMFEGFDSRITKSKRLVAYEHFERGPFGEVLGLETMKNDAPLGIRAVTDFIGKSEFLLTNTYHGAYWGVLLGCRVILTESFCTRFARMPWVLPVLGRDGTMEECMEKARVYDSAVAACRFRNIEFANGVKPLLTT